MNQDLHYQESLCKTFQLLSVLFCEPDREIIHSKDVYDALTRSSEIISKDLFDLSKEIKNSVYTFPYDEILVEYTRLFLGPFTTIAPPYGSVYLDNNILMGDSTQEVLRYYNQCGLKFDEELKDLPDNIVVEMEFIYYLLFNRLEALNEGNEESNEDITRQLSFFNETFFVPWVPQFCDRIINGSENGFYVNLAKYLKFVIGFIK